MNNAYLAQISNAHPKYTESSLRDSSNKKMGTNTAAKSNQTKSSSDEVVYKIKKTSYTRVKYVQKPNKK